MLFATKSLAVRLTTIFVVVIESVLTEAANEGGDRFPMTWIRSHSKLFFVTPGSKLTSLLCDSLNTGEKGEEAARPSLKQSNFECVDRWGMLCCFPLLRYTDETVQEQLGYFILSQGPKTQDITVYMTEGGRHE